MEFLQIAITVGAAIGGAFARELPKAVKKHWPGRSRPTPAPMLPAPPPGISAYLADALSIIEHRITDGFADTHRRMETGFSRVDDSLAQNRSEVGAIRRSMLKLQAAVDDHTGRDHERLDARLETIEGRIHQALKTTERPA